MKASRKKYPLDQSPLFKISTHRRLAEQLRIDEKTLRRLSRWGRDAYSVWADVSSKGKVRVIENPRPALKRVHSQVAGLLSLIEPPEFLTCPVKGRSYVTNARHHSGAQEIVTLDVSSYFQATTWKRVYWFFNKRMKMPPDLAWTLASLATVEEHLPTGSPLSPILAYFAHEEIWLRVMRAVRDAQCKLTLYMDDLTISGERVPASLVWAVKRIIHSSGLRMNERKQHRYGRGEGLVTGVVVTPQGVRPPKASYLKLKKLQDEYELANSERRAQITQQLKGLKAQHNQVLKIPKGFQDI